MKIPAMTYGSRQRILCGQARGKRVLHLGCVGDRPLKSEEANLHELLAEEAMELWGVDLNQKGLEELAKRLPALRGRLLTGDACKLGDVIGLPHEFDVIIAGDIIEHLTNPAALFDSCRPLLTSGGVVLISTPNALGLLNVLRSWRGNEQVNPAHTCWFSFATLQELTRRVGWHIDKFFTCYDHESHPYWRRMAATRFFNWFPQWGGTLVAVVRPVERGMDP
ncbi:MAG: class I SAM-dependent methyltransferase [Terriglobales bacterium]